MFLQKWLLQDGFNRNEIQFLKEGSYMKLFFIYVMVLFFLIGCGSGGGGGGSGDATATSSSSGSQNNDFLKPQIPEIP